MLTGAELGAILASPAFIIPALAAGVVMLALAMARSVPLAVKEALELRLPTPVQERSSYIRKVRDIFLRRTKVDIYKLGVVTLTPESAEKSARELSYTKEEIETLVHDLSTTVEELGLCDFIPETLEALANSVEATTFNSRSVLVFISGVISKTIHLAVKDTMQSASHPHKLNSAVTHEVNKKKAAM